MHIKVKYLSDSDLTINSLTDIINLMKKRPSIVRSVGGVRRDFIIQPSFDNYGTLGSVHFSINGSPPKGHAILSFTDTHGVARLLIADSTLTDVVCYQVRVSSKFYDSLVFNKDGLTAKGSFSAFD